MMKYFTLFLSVCLIISFSGMAFGQVDDAAPADKTSQAEETIADMLAAQKPTVETERSPNNTIVNYANPSDALFDFQFEFDLNAATGANGNAGSEFDGTYFYSTRWASNLIHRYDINGALVEEFSKIGRAHV